MCLFLNFLTLLSCLILLVQHVNSISITFNPSRVEKLRMGDAKKVVHFSLFDIGTNQTSLRFISKDPSIVSVELQDDYVLNDTSMNQLNGTVTLKGQFMGHSNIYLELNNDTIVEPSLPISVVREKGIISTIFTSSVATLVSLNYINMGCAADVNVVKSVLKKPIAPVIGFVSQYLFMPLISFGVAMLFFDDLYLRMGLFTFGCSPGGGASNMWTFLLKGNLNLSLTMTFISTLAAMGMMPLWLFTLGKTLFHGTPTKVPFQNILFILISMAIPLMIGVWIQKYLPRVAKFCKKILAPVCGVMILYIIIFGTYANWFMFQLFDAKILFAAALNVWLGFFFGGFTAKLAGLSFTDVLTISIETGIQNTGIAIVLLGFSLTPPDSDMAAIVPVAGSIMTPFPLLVIMLYQRLRRGSSSQKGFDMMVDDEQPVPMSTSSTQSNLVQTPA